MFDFKLFLVKKRYKKIIKNLQNNITARKLKVIFLIRENQKWTYQSLYEEFEKSDKFEPLVLVSLLTLAAKGKDKTRNNLEENYEFFKSRNINVDYAYKNGKYVDLKEFKPDIVFYDQPWDLPEIHKPFNVSKFALTYYCSYSYELIDCPDDYTSDFHRFLCGFFVEHELNIKRYASYNKENIKNCVAVGYPKLDEYFEDTKECDIWKNKDKIKVIYAPHHSLDKKGLKLATFKENGLFILELAKSHPETEWVFKPHPRLKYALLKNKIMNENEINAYFKEWEKIATVYEKGDYFDIFKSSDLMISDCCSFLAEYLLTGKPLIRPINKRSVPLNDLGKEITKGCYFTSNNIQLEEIFEDIVVNKNDYKKEEREVLINKIVDLNKKSYKKIFDLITETVRGIK